MTLYRTDYSDAELNDAITDEFGVKYSRDGKRLIKGCDIEGYVVRNGTEIICDRAFQSMSFAKITLPASVKALGICCFANNTLLEDINFPSSIEYLANNNPFGGCFTLKHINIESDKFIIDNHLLYSSDFCVLFCAFHCFEDGSIVEVDNRTVEISANCFWSHNNISNLFIPKSVRIIGNAAFKCCKIKRIEVKGEIEILPEQFVANSCLDYLEIPQTVKIIKKKAFCLSNIKKVILGKSVEKIEEFAFSYSKGVTSICFNKLKEIDTAAFKLCTGLETLKINGPIKEIPYQAFWGCLNLNYLEIGESVSTIKDEAISNEPQLRKIVLKGNIKRIGNENFTECDNLSEISTTKDNYFHVLYAITKQDPRLEGIIYDGFYSIPRTNELYTASLELERAYIRSASLDPSDRFSFIKPYLQAFSKEKYKIGWFKRTEHRDYCTTGHAALISSLFINKKNEEKKFEMCICALSDFGLGYYYFSNKLRHNECAVYILQTLLEHKDYLAKVIDECLKRLKIETCSRNEFLAYIIEYLFYIITADGDDSEISISQNNNPIVDFQRINNKRALFVKKLLIECPDFYNRNDYEEKFDLYYTSFMKIVRQHVLSLTEDYIDIIEEEASCIRNKNNVHDVDAEGEFTYICYTIRKAFEKISQDNSALDYLAEYSRVLSRLLNVKKECEFDKKNYITTGIAFAIHTLIFETNSKNYYTKKYYINNAIKYLLAGIDTYQNKKWIAECAYWTAIVLVNNELLLNDCLCDILVLQGKDVTTYNIDLLKSYLITALFYCIVEVDYEKKTYKPLFNEQNGYDFEQFYGQYLEWVGQPAEEDDFSEQIQNAMIALKKIINKITND